MFEILRLRRRLGSPAIAAIRSATPPRGFVGMPALESARCANCGGGAATKGVVASASPCRAACPSGAILADELAAAGPSLRLDLGRCAFCRDCERACPEGAIRFGSFHALAASSREALVVDPSSCREDEYEKAALASRRELRRLFGRSLKLREVSAGGCNACEMEMNAATNVNFDMGRFGIEWVASPRHADGLVLTGPISANMAAALSDAWDAMPEPKILVLAGACAISGGAFAESGSLDRSFLDRAKPDLYVPGCPPHPLTFIHGLLGLLGLLGAGRKR
jgi:Ni,Fe-hydrogenase III small subunit/NAD-dependent dihydropyrimidine dehydrogenase PreA subunit